MATKTKAGLLDRDTILASSLSQEIVETPEWGGSVIVRCLTGAERDAWDAWRFRLAVIGEWDLLAKRNVRAKMVSLSTIAADGAHLFTEADVAALGELDSAPLDRIYSTAMRLSKITVSDRDIEAVAEVFTKGRNGSTGSG